VFIEAAADIIRDMETGRFDVVLASYSLYFFPHLIGEIARILKDRGVFVAVTHSERTLEELIAFVWRSMREARIQRTDELRISRLFREFSVEGGRDMLEPFFRHVECIPYENSLAFPLDPGLGLWMQQALVLAMRMVLPFFGALLLADVGLGFVARTVPQMNIFVLGLPLKVALGFFLLRVVLPMSIDLLHGEVERVVETALGILQVWR
jgi:SAM-dependent methyltransferase